MNEDWNDLAKMWQADAAGVSVQEIDAHLRQERRQMRGVMVAEFMGMAVGLAAAALVLFFTPRMWMGLLIVAFGGASAWMTLRMRRDEGTAASVDLISSLKEAIAREDWITGQLRTGRALSLVALVAIVSALSVQLHAMKSFSANVLIAAGLGCAVVTAALAWNLVLTARSRRRRERLEYLAQRLKA